VHISLAHPVCKDLAQSLYTSCKELDIRAHNGGTYINMEGPAFSTLAESKLYRSWGMDIIGMTNFAEAKLAREAEICYATLAAITDYDCWYESAESVTVDMVIQNLMKNVDNSKKIIKQVIKSLPQDNDCSCRHALKDAIVTDRKIIPAKLKKDLKIIIGKYVK
jgi:5'-methylthioadenosine phosphorylase